MNKTVMQLTNIRWQCQHWVASVCTDATVRNVSFVSVLVLLNRPAWINYHAGLVKKHFPRSVGSAFFLTARNRYERKKSKGGIYL